jgi:(p)ppGpp synthase/HD superfamily hydrolase
MGASAVYAGHRRVEIHRLAGAAVLKEGIMIDTNEQQTCAETVRRILEAARFASEKHARQKRKGNAAEPYINHLIEVAQLIAASSDIPDTNLIMAGLLHDTIEDTAVTAGELERRFGSDVAGLVLEATDDKSLPKETRKALQVETAAHKSPRAQALKLADKVSNLRSLLTSPPAEWSAERKHQYCEWARQVVQGFTSPNSFLMAEFNKTYSELLRSAER